MPIKARSRCRSSAPCHRKPNLRRKKATIASALSGRGRRWRRARLIRSIPSPLTGEGEMIASAIISGGGGACGTPPPIVFRVAQDDCPLPQGEGERKIHCTVKCITVLVL